MKRTHITLAPVGAGSTGARFGAAVCCGCLLAALLSVLFCFAEGAAACAFITAAGAAAALAALAAKPTVRATVGGGLAAVCVLVSPVGFARGIVWFANQLITVYNSRFETCEALFALPGITARDRLQPELLLAVALALLAGGLVRRRAAAGALLCGLALLSTAVFFRLGVPLWAWLALCGGVLLLASLDAVSSQPLVRAALFVVLAFALFAPVYVLTADARPAAAAAQLRGQVIDTVDELRYGSDTLPQGKLTEAAGLVGSAEIKTLTLSAESLSEMHLRGFVGGAFDGTAWQPPAAADYTGDADGMLEWLAQLDFLPQYQYTAYRRVTGLPGQSAAVRVINQGAYRRYLYLPCTASGLVQGTGTPRYDGALCADGLRGQTVYAFRTYLVNDTVEQAYIGTVDDHAPGAADYTAAEGVYGAFVETCGLDLVDEEKALLEKAFFDGWPLEDATLSAVTTRIRLKLQQCMQYSETPDRYTGGEDFVQWLLAEKRSANAAYYATAAVLAYRAAGVPARYVEGYHLTAGQAAAGGVATLTQADAHAWAEIYVHGVGWLATEVVPGRYSAEYTTEGVLPSPDTTVNVVEGEDETLQGKTGDSLEPSAGEKPPKPSAPEQLVSVVLGGGILALAAAFALRWVLRAQSTLRRRRRERRLRGCFSAAHCREAFQHAMRVLSVAGLQADLRFPQHCEAAFAARFHRVDVAEYHRFVMLVERVCFGSGELSAAEYETVCLFPQRLASEAYDSGSALQRFQLHTLYALC